jgi:hypothetical protein
MLNSEVSHSTAAESTSQVSQYFSILSGTPLMSDTDKRYFHTQNACYSPSCPVAAGSYTTVIISPAGENMADLYNGYIYAEMQIGFENVYPAIPSTDIADAWTWVGFKDSFDSIEKYEILSNGITIYTQNYAIEESYILNCASTDNMRKCDLYSKVIHEHLWKEEFLDTCGTWVNWSRTSDPAYWNKPHTIKLKIDIRHFLPLSNVKYLPAFAGKIELRLYFGIAGLVCSNVDPIRIINHNGAGGTGLTAFTVADYDPLPVISNEFVQLGDNITMIIKDTKPVKEDVNFTVTVTSEIVDENGITIETPVHANRAIRVLTKSGSLTTGIRNVVVQRNYKIIQCETLINVFGLYHEIYEGLKAKYTREPLNYPTQILQISNMSSVLNSTASKASLTITPRFVDSIFLLFPLKNNNRTVFKNPQFNTFQLTCATYGSIPSSAFGTVNEPRLVEMCSNAVNLNTDVNGLSKVVLKSLISTTDYDEGNQSFDRTSFFIGLPTETDNTFQQGQTSDTPINYELSITQDSGNHYKENVESPPLMCLLLDAVFSIQVQEYGAPLAVLGANDITTPVRA